MAPISRNMTTDNWFTSVPLIKKLRRVHKLTFLGTENIIEFTEVKHRPIKSTMFGYGNTMTLLSYVPQKNKNILMISSFNNSDAIDSTSGEKNKLEIITSYDFTKGGVDTVDQFFS